VPLLRGAEQANRPDPAAGFTRARAKVIPRNGSRDRVCASDRKRIVILEDSPDCARLFQAILTRGGYEAPLATACSEVQEWLSSNAVHALVVDPLLSTQWCHGTDIALRSHRTHPDLKFLFVSGTPFGDWSETDRQNVAELPGSSWDILEKPFTHSTLLSRLTALLQRPPARSSVHPGCPRNGDCARLNPAGTGLPFLG